VLLVGGGGYRSFCGYTLIVLDFPKCVRLLPRVLFGVEERNEMVVFGMCAFVFVFVFGNRFLTKNTFFVCLVLFIIIRFFLRYSKNVISVSECVSWNIDGKRFFGSRCVEKNFLNVFTLQVR